MAQLHEELLSSKDECASLQSRLQTLESPSQPLMSTSVRDDEVSEKAGRQMGVSKKDGRQRIRED